MNVLLEDIAARPVDVSTPEAPSGLFDLLRATPQSGSTTYGGIGSLIGSSHQHSARKDLNRRAHRYADALAESSAQGRNDEADFRTLAKTLGGGRLGMVNVIPAATSTVVTFEGNEHGLDPL